MVDFESISVLSVDAFDTLILRSVPHPEDVFHEVGARAGARGLLQPRVTPAQFASLRRQCEQAARVAMERRSQTSEVTLQEIYDSMPDDLFAVPCAEVAALEIEVEGELAYPNPVILDLIRAARGRGIPVALVSDTYLGEGELRRLLQATGIPLNWFDVVLPSSAARCSKRDGRLFEWLCRLFPGVAPRSILHIGDNPHSDVAQPRSAGLSAALYDPGVHATRERFRLEEVRHGRILPQIASLRRLASSIDSGDGDVDWWFGLGATVLGPLLAAFADWVVAECVRDGLRTVRPLMREGRLLSALIARAAERQGAALDVRPLHASRSATWLAGLDGLDGAAIEQLLRRHQLTIGEAMRCAGLPTTAAGPVLSNHLNLSLAEAARTHIGGRTALDHLRDRLASPTARRRSAAAIASARSRVSRYLDQECGAATDVVLVDIGFRGSIGRALERCTRHVSPRRYHQLLVFGVESVARLWGAGCDVRVFAAGPGFHQDLAGPIARHAPLLETLLVEGGTTLGYRETASGAIAPVLDRPRVPTWQPRLTRACRAGILAFQARWLDWSDRHPALARTVAHDRRGLTQLVHRLIAFPSNEEARRLGALVHEDNEGSRSVRPLIEPAPARVPDPDEYLDAVAGAAPPLGLGLWPTGACERQWPGYLERAWHRLAGTDDGSPPAMPRLAAQVRRANVRRCAVWGAGEAGSALVRALQQQGVEVTLVTDSNADLWGTLLEGIPVVSPAEARRRGADVFAIGSCAFAEEIAATIARLHDSTPVRVFSVASEEAA